VGHPLVWTRHNARCVGHPLVDIIARRMLEAEEALEEFKYSPDYLWLARSMQPYWWELEPRYAVPPYNKVDVPDMPPRPRVLKRLIREAKLKMQKKERR
jgi:hypothetical protein